MGTYAHSRARIIARNGSPVTLRRTIAVGQSALVETMAVISSYNPTQLTGGIQQGDLRADLANDIANSAWPVPPRSRDEVVIEGQTYAVKGVTPVRCLDGTIGWTLWLRGGA